MPRFQYYSNCFFFSISGKCLKCKPGFYFSMGQCKSCPEGCIKCDYFDFCLQCKHNYNIIKLDEKVLCLLKVDR